MTTTNNASLSDTVNQIASRHIDLSRQYGCRAFMVVVTFLFAGVAHRARKLYRADMAGTGKIELYTLEPRPANSNSTMLGWYEGVASEDWLGYAAAEPTSRRDRLAALLVAQAEGGDELGADMSARFELIELS